MVLIRRIFFQKQQQKELYRMKERGCRLRQPRFILEKLCCTHCTELRETEICLRMGGYAIISI